MVHLGTFSKQQRRFSAVIFVTGIVLLILVIWGWWHFVYSKPSRTFFGAIDNSLRTTTVSKHVVQKAPGQELNQHVALNLNPTHIAHAKTIITENTQTHTTVRTESISTPKEDFVRYTDIDTDQKGASGKVLDFSKLFHIWGKSNAQGGQTTGELYSESVLGVIPVGNLSASERTEVMDFIRDKNVFKFDEAKVTRQLKGSRPVYTYDITIAPEGYVGMLKIFAKAVGMTQLEGVNPSQFRTAQPFKVKVMVDVWARQVIELAYGQDRTEHLGGHGIQHDIDVPKKSIPVDELQQRLQSIQ